MKRTLLVLLTAVVVVGCGRINFDGDEAPAVVAPKTAPPKVAKDADLPPGQDVADLWETYATDAVAWRDRARGRYATIHLRPPHDVKESGDGRFYTVQFYPSGRRDHAARIYLRDADARRLSRINREEERVPGDKFLFVRALIDDEGFGFSDGQLSLVDRARE